MATNQALECFMCVSQPIDARLLPCGHSICKQCRETLLVFNEDGSATLQCPYRCKEVTTVLRHQTLEDVLKKSFAMESILGNLKKSENTDMMRCSEQGCENLIKQYCSEVQKKLCNSCIGKHKHSGVCHHSIVFDHHTGHFQLVCYDHNSIAKTVLLPSNELICMYCKHRTYKGKRIQDLASKAKESRISFANRLSALNSIAETKQDCEAEDKKLDDFREELCNELHVWKIMNIKNYIERMNEEETKILKEYDAEKKKYKMQRNGNTELCKLVKSFPTKEEDFTMITDRRWFCTQVDRLSQIFSVSLQNATTTDSLGNLEIKLKSSTGATEDQTLDVNIETPHWEESNTSELENSLVELVQASMSRGDFGLQYLNLIFKEDLERIQDYSWEDIEIHVKNVRNVKSLRELKLVVLSKLALKDKEKNPLENLMISASKFGNCELLETLLLLDRGVINLSCNEDGNTLLMYAAQTGHVDCIRLLLQHNCNVDMTNKLGSTALMFASDKGYADCVALLQQHSCDVDMKNKSGWTALMFASYAGQVDCVALLLQNNSAVDAKSNRGTTALMYASQNGHEDCVNLLLQHNCNVDMKNKSGYTALTLASYAGHADCVRLHLQYYCGVDITDKHTGTALMYASQEGHAECVKLLLRYNCDVNMRNNEGKTALMFASYAGHADCVRLLLQHHCDVDMRNNGGKTALMSASYAGHADCVKLLLQHTCDIDMRNNGGKTALMFASYAGQADCVLLLLQHNCVVDIMDKQTMTALEYATQKGHAECIRLLQQHKCNINYT